MEVTMREFTGSRLALLALLLAWSGAAAAEPMLAKVDLFTAGEGGYALYRIPCLVVSSKGTLLALCEARKSDKGDWGSIDILLRRSSDEGKTWSAPRKVAAVAGPHRRNPAAVAQKLGAAEDVTYNNPVAIVDRKTGAIHLLFCLEYMRCFYQRSDDDGLTFSRPVEITAVFDTFRPDYDWKVLAAGPGHGIQLAGGRLLVPVWLSTGSGGHAHRPSVASVIYSDDHGATWRRGDIAVPHTQTFVNPSEAMLVERADGSVMLNVRSESAPHRRLISVSKDGATGWSTPAFHDDLVEPICMASLLRLSQNRLLFANPANLERGDGKAKPGVSRDRKNLSVRLSLDDGKSWPLRKTLEPGPSAYSDLAVGAGGTIYCLYERGSGAPGQPARSYMHLTLARFNLEWLFDGSDRLKQR
jgi:sialidase-1